MLTLPLLLLACSAAESNLAPESGEADRDIASTDETGADSGSTDGEDDHVEAVFYSVRATLRVAEGAASTEDAAVAVALAGADQADAGCVVELAVDDLAAAEAQEGILVGWTLPVVVGEETCGVTAFPATLTLGLGALDPEVRARLGAAGVEEPAESLFGAYLAVDGGESYAIGYATDGSAEDAAATGLRDGLYRFEPLLLVRLPAAEE